VPLVQRNPGDRAAGCGAAGGTEAVLINKELTAKGYPQTSQGFPLRALATFAVKIRFWKATFETRIPSRQDPASRPPRA
ncbi:MAG: hypothetical protein WAK92_00195, partial [Thiobacillus sp.]